MHYQTSYQKTKHTYIYPNDINQGNALMKLDKVENKQEIMFKIYNDLFSWMNRYSQLLIMKLYLWAIYIKRS